MWFREKGPIWTIFDHYFSNPDYDTRLRHKLEVLCGFHRTQHFTDYDRGPGKSGLDIPELKRHINRDWFGLSEDGCTSTVPEHGGTGIWQGWRGDAEGIVRDALIRAIEVSLGLEHLPWTGEREDPLGDYRIGSDGPVPRNWSMAFWASGPVPWLQASVAWNAGEDEDGRVEVTWLLPAARQRFQGDLSTDTNEYDVNPPNPGPGGPRNGSWIIGQESTRPELGRGTRIIHVSRGPTVVVQPTLAAGGVKPGGE
jgi:hypothetical protein